MLLREPDADVKAFTRKTGRRRSVERPLRFRKRRRRVAVEPAQARAVEMHSGEPGRIAQRGIRPQRDVDLVACSRRRRLDHCRVGQFFA